MLSSQILAGVSCIWAGGAGLWMDLHAGLSCLSLSLAVTEVLGSGHLPPTVKSPHVGEFCFLVQASEGALAGMLVLSPGELPQPDHPAVQEISPPF